MARLRIKEEAKAAGITLEELAERVGIDQGHFTRQVSGKRPIKFGQMEAVAKELQRPVTALIEEEDEDGNLISAPPAKGISGLIRIPVIGDIQAGSWRDANEHAIDTVLQELYIPPDHRLGSAPVAFKVFGDSYDEFVREGGYVIGFRFQDRPVNLKAGMTVVAQRSRAEGQMVERTLKMVRPLRNGTFELQPRSSNKHHKPIHFPSAEDEDFATVYAVVTTFVQPAEWSP